MHCIQKIVNRSSYWSFYRGKSRQVGNFNSVKKGRDVIVIKLQHTLKSAGLVTTSLTVSSTLALTVCTADRIEEFFHCLENSFCWC